MNSDLAVGRLRHWGLLNDLPFRKALGDPSLGCKSPTSSHYLCPPGALFIPALVFAACHGMLLLSLLLKPVVEHYIKCKISGASVLHRNQVSELSQSLSHCRPGTEPEVLLHTWSDLFWWVIAWGKGLSRRKYPQMTLSFPGGTLGSIRWKQAGIASLCPDLLETRSGCWPLGKRKKNISETSLSCLGSSSAFLCQTTASRPTFCVFGLSRALVIYLHNLEMPPSIGSPVLAVLPQAPKEDINSSHHPEGCS